MIMDIDKFLRTIISDLPQSRKWRDKLHITLSVTDLEDILLLFENQIKQEIIMSKKDIL